MVKLNNIDRREFLSGVAAFGAAAMLPGSAAHAAGTVFAGAPDWIYPPARTGMRGTHDGSFEVAHDVAWGGKRFARPADLTDRPYDLVIVGAGISGLSAAVMARRQMGNKARILILDNHDDFGGHAKRNEFTVDGQKLIGYGGSQSIDTPSQYSAAAADFLKSLTIDTERFYRYFDQSFYERRNLGAGLYLDAGLYGGAGKLHVRKDADTYAALWGWSTAGEKAAVHNLIDSLPVEVADKEILRRILLDKEDWLAGMTHAEKKAYLQTHSCAVSLQEKLGLSEKALGILGSHSLGLWGLGWDAVSGLEVCRMWHPVMEPLGLAPSDLNSHYGSDPYIFHFPDGNASIARLCVAQLVPDALQAKTMEEGVKAQVHYDRLDKSSNLCRIRLSATVVDARNSAEGVEVTYVRDGVVERVSSRSAIMACWNNILPHIMPEMPAVQREALRYAEKVPLTYVNVALRNWRAFEQAGIAHIAMPGGLLSGASLDFPVSMGGYSFPQSADQPILLHMTHVPTRPGLPARQQHREGRRDMLALSFGDFEAAIVGQLNGALGYHGFVAEDDIAAITVNRWPHGYAYEYNELFDLLGWGPAAGPHVAGRQTIGNIAIANSDASAYAYVNGAVDAASRALASLL